MSENLNEVFEEAMQDAAVITVPIDDTLSNSGEAADAAAVGAALALKADLADISNIKVNEQAADNQGQILLDGRDVPMSDTDTTTLTAAITAAGSRTGADIPINGEPEAQTIAEAVEALSGAVKTVNGDAPDENGNVSIQRVNLAGNLETEFKATSEGVFLQRTSGGSAAIIDGQANLLSVMGNNVHTGFVAEVIAMDVQPADSESDLAASINKATWRDYVNDSGTTTFTYTSGAWKIDGTTVTLADYGIAITAGTAEENDAIVVSYVKEERGTITPAQPTQFVATGWNLFSASRGYAKVVKYSEEYGYKVSGAYTQLQFAATVGGTRSTITPNSAGIFQIPSDGYVFVTGGDSTSTAIFPTWSDWTEGYPGEFQGYTQTVIDLSLIMMTYFPNGMFSVGNVRDEISIVNGAAISRIDRWEYNEDTLDDAVATGREYKYDENYIYIVKANATSEPISISGVFTANDHGTEYFEGSDVPVYCKAQYNANLKNKLERDTVTISQQTLSASEQEQIRTNIGAAGQAAVNALLNGMVMITEHSRTLDADIAINKTKTIAAADFTPAVAPIPGYTPVAVLLASTLSALLPYTFTPTTSGTVIGVRNYSTAATGTGKTVKIRMIWVKNEFLG